MDTPLFKLLNGRYELYERLGSGSFGEVWRGADTHQETVVAVKLINPTVTLDEVLLEARLLARLREHPRVVTVRDVQIVPPLPFIVMDYLPLGSIQTRLDADSVGLVDAVRWIREGLAGLAHAHSLNVLHRDIKPGNLLLDGQERAALSDFGLAEDTARILVRNNLVYTRHAAPELLHNDSTVQSDIWAMGCTLYRLLTNRYPFEGPDEASTNPLLAPHRINPQIPMALTRLVQRALAVDTGRRYKDATQMLTALTSCKIAHGWTRTAEAPETWKLRREEETYVLTLAALKGKWEVLVRRDRGRGLRTVTRMQYERPSEAVRSRRALLVAGVEGKTLS